VSDRNKRTAGSTPLLVWTAAACITVSLLVMIVISVAGPSIAVPAMARPSGAPPWWVALGWPESPVLFLMWGAAIVGVIGVGAGLVAIARGARPRVRPLLAASFIAVAAFAVLPPGGTTDTQSYAIDGNMVILGHSPYVNTPKQMAGFGDKLAMNSPSTWQKSLSDYGPLATAEEWVSAEFGGSSMAQITFWLKLWVEIAFAAVVLLLDRVLRSDPAMRLRAHLLWSVNPLVLWEIVASGHIDGLAVALGLAGLVLLRFHAPDKAPPSVLRCLAAGALIGAAAAVKSPFALFGIGAVWAVRRSPAAIASVAAGAIAVAVPSYAIAGIVSVKVLFQRGNQITWDNLYQVIYRPLTGVKFGSDVPPTHLGTIALILFIVVALLAFFRMPDGVPGLPAVTPTLALSLGWIFFWPFQRPWYDVMIIVLLALYPPSWLDVVVLARLCFGAVTYMDAVAIKHPAWLLHTQLFEGEWVTSTARFLTAATLVWMCISGRWGIRGKPSSAPVSPPPPVLQPQP
jgi:alpha-1,6-mannosyltransferase